MSNWKTIKKEDIEQDGDELNIYIGSDESGNNYVVLKIVDVQEILKNLI